MQFIQYIDTSILLFFQDHLRCGFLNAVMIFFSAIGTWGLVWIVAAAVMLVSKKYRYTGIVLLLCLAVTWGLNDGVLKNLVHRPRPYVTLTGLNVLVPRLHDFSFPSGHTSTGFAAAYAVTHLNGRRWAWVYIAASVIAVSRLYLGMHYPTDVLGGIVLGTLSAAGVCALMRLILKPEKLRGNSANN
ncbi:MAG TPA: phosphatase PAP2 family protein [Armatimonadota bacterium]|nr:phosphatase PAP2 family protein [Armatimonadota bacterium]